MSEISDTAVLVKLGGEGTYFLIKGAVKGILHLYQTMKKMNAAKILGNGEVEDFEKFLKATEGQYKILNIPTENPDEIAKMKEDLNKLHIGYTVLPDLNVGDGQIQLAYAIADTDKVESWYRSFCLDKMQAGGEKSYQDLVNFTDGQVSIVNIPWPDADVPEKEIDGRFETLKQDMQQSKSTYPKGIMPDLNTADNHIQIIVPSYYAEDMHDWYAHYAECHKDDIRIETINDYLKTGVMDEYDYVDTASKDLKIKLQLTKNPKVQNPLTEVQDRPLEIPEGEVSLEELAILADNDVSVAALHMPEDVPEMVAQKTPRPEKTNISDGRTIAPDKPRKITKKEHLSRLKEDLDKLYINYAILPDLHVSDGYIQIAFATVDAQKLKAWYEAYQNDMLTAGMPIEDMKEMTLDDYINTGQVERQERPETIHKAERTPNAERAPKSPVRQATKQLSEYETLSAKQGMIEVSVNESLVDSKDPMSQEGFRSRIPGSMEYVHIKPELLYTSDGGKTYGFLVSGNTEIAITDRDGNYLRTAQMRDIEQHYNPVRSGGRAADKEIIYRKAEDPNPILKVDKSIKTPQEIFRQDAHIPGKTGTIEHKEPDSRNKNRFNNFEQRVYSADFFESLERTSLEQPKSPFEQTLDRMVGSNTQFVQELDASVNTELVTIREPIEIKALENGDIMFVARIPDTGDYYTGIADAAVQKEDGTIGEVAISRYKDVAIVNEAGDFFRTSKISEIVKAIMDADDPVKAVKNTAQKMAEKLLQGPKL